MKYQTHLALTLKKINLFIQKIFYYKFNLVQQNLNWIGSRACKKIPYITSVVKKYKR